MSLLGGQEEKEQSIPPLCTPSTTPSYNHLGFALQGRINAQYGSFLPVTCFPGARGAITWSTLDTVMRASIGLASRTSPVLAQPLVSLGL